MNGPGMLTVGLAAPSEFSGWREESLWWENGSDLCTHIAR